VDAGKLEEALKDLRGLPVDVTQEQTQDRS